jgi:hypothetical protein
MRPNLIGLLDHIGVHQWLDISGCAELFGNKAELLQSTSMLRFPVFVDGANYSGSPNTVSHSLLRKTLLDHFGRECGLLKRAVFVPLGDKVVEGLRFLCSEGLLDRSRVLEGLPHPSGANAERIAYFLGRKKKEQLSPKTDPRKLEQARQTLSAQVLALA